jgi:hypothetical protein
MLPLCGVSYYLNKENPTSIGLLRVAMESSRSAASLRHLRRNKVSPLIGFFIFLVSCISLVRAQCALNFVQQVWYFSQLCANLVQNPTYTNLNISSPFTYVETVFGCSPVPYVWTEWRTAYVDGGTYTCPNVTIFATTSTEATYIFPDLILTKLHQGDVISMVSRNY